MKALVQTDWILGSDMMLISKIYNCNTFLDNVGKKKQQKTL